MATHEAPTTSSTPFLVDEELRQRQEEHRSSAFRQRVERMLSPITDHQDSLPSIFFGLLFVTVCGSLLGLLMPKNESLPTPFYRIISSMIGYTCFVAWGVSFYPQVINNLKRRTTLGLSADFCGLNVLGFACYAIYNLSLFYSAEVQKEYREQHDGAPITVQSNDVAFAMHSFVLASITFLQIVYFDGLRSQQQPSRIILYFIAVVSVLAVAYPLLQLVGMKFGTWLQYLYMLSFVKILVTLTKYIPQVILNLRRKSTIGFSIWQILLDLNGGVLNDLQLVLDSMDMKDWAGITGNPAKLCLGIISIIFDIIFIVQHYWLYRNTNDTDLDELIMDPFTTGNNYDAIAENEGEAEDECE
ncbi:cystinosin [Fistulifera solaris]|jgi:cystinosin|uniref:Cystinosin n=1 Tax=Fistulifera solaris TaxID=1519565 RepID=A0A1Z5JQ24_FISSO|nr:cystinosin [Fistulifera solaris]|eukprot:GAX16130.1 cystinosin [Fistulifera solaris]